MGRPARSRFESRTRRSTEPVARDLVDDDGVEIVHRRVAVAVEGDRRDSRQRGRDLLQRVLHARVERRAPEGGPVAAAAVEAGVDEALRDGALGQLHDGEEGPRGAARLQARRRSGCERDERARIEPARGESVPDAGPARRSRACRGGARRRRVCRRNPARRRVRWRPAATRARASGSPEARRERLSDLQTRPFSLGADHDVPPPPSSCSEHGQSPCSRSSQELRGAWQSHAPRQDP